MPGAVKEVLLMLVGSSSKSELLLCSEDGFVLILHLTYIHLCPWRAVCISMVGGTIWTVEEV